MIEINLIPDVKQELIRAERVRSIVISTSIAAGLIAVGVVVALSLYVFGVQSVRGNLSDDAIKKTSQELAGVEDLSKVLTIQNQLSVISSLNDQKKINSRVFDVLLAVVPPAPNTVQVSNMLVDSAENTITIEGQSPVGYSALEVFKKTIDGAVVMVESDGERSEVKLAEDISTTNVSYGEDSTGAKVLRFTIAFTYPDELFSPKVSSVVVKLTNQGNVTDSFLGIPRSIFTQRATDIEGGSE